MRNFMNWIETFEVDNFKNRRGFTLIELLIAMGVGIVVIAAIYMAFAGQQDSYVIQTQISSTQQNLRSAMYRITQDIQMAGYHTNFVGEPYTMNWDGLGGNESKETIKPVIYGRRNIEAPGIKPNSDMLVVVQADRGVWRFLSAAENIPAGDTTTVPGSVRDIGLKSGYYGLLVKKNLNMAEIFRVPDTYAEGSDFDITLKEDYGENDMIFRVDIFSYFIDKDLNLCVKNLARAIPKKQTVAENIENLKVRYILKDGSATDDIGDGSRVPDVRAVEISLLGRTAKPIKGYTDTKSYTMAGEVYTPDEKSYQRRLLSTTILTRNIGL